MLRAALALGGVLAAVCASDAVQAGPSSRANECTCYPWPVAPFDVQHPVRAFFGDPRTVFVHRAGGDEVMRGSGRFSFHNGIDIDAPNGTAVYPVESGVVRRVKRNYSLTVQAADGRRFTYTHLTTLVKEGQPVTAGSTELGLVSDQREHLHFSEISPTGRVVDPLLPNHLTPYDDTTRPVVAALEVRVRGRTIVPINLHGTIGLVADAFDMPMPADDALFSVTRFARDRFPVAPAAVSWSLATLDGRIVIPKHAQLDFRDGLPGSRDFWRVYTRGTYQNRVWIKPHVHTQMPGRYLFWLTPVLYTDALSNGVYVVTATVVDTRGNTGSLRTRIDVRNAVLPGR